MSTACAVCLGTWSDCDYDAAAASSAVGSHAISRLAPSSFASAAAADGSQAAAADGLRATVVISSDDDDSDDADSNDDYDDDGEDGWDDGDDDDDEDNDYGQDDFSGGSCHYDEFDEDKEIESSDFTRHRNGHLHAAVDDYAFGRDSTGSGADHNVSLDALLLQYSIQQQHHVSITNPKRERSSLHSQQHQYQQMPLIPHADPRLGGCIIV
jgi:hypothetical protein